MKQTSSRSKKKLMMWKTREYLSMYSKKKIDSDDKPDATIEIRS